MNQRDTWTLRWAFIWALLTGDVMQISYHGGTYRVDVTSASVRRWKRKNDRRRAKEALRREADANRRA